MRSYERPLVALMALLVVLLLLAIFQPRLLLITTSETSVAGAADHQAAADPVDDDGELPRAAEAHNSQRGATGPPIPSEGPPYDRPAANKDRPSDQLLCSAPQRLATLNNDGLALAADPDGHYTLYTLPNTVTGLPSQYSYELLRGCLPKKIFANTTDLKIGESAETSSVKRPTRRIAMDTGSQLVTTYEAPGKLSLTQRLELQSGKLKITYDLENTSAEPTSVALRSLLSPTPANPGQDVLFELPNAGPKDRITRDTTIRGDAASQTRNVWAPRPGAAGDSTALWQPAVGPHPSKIVFAGFHRLHYGPFDYDATDRYPLPPNSSLAVYWEDIPLKPGETVTVGQTYGPETDRASGR
jgi:hypothetical protein